MKSSNFLRYKKGNTLLHRMPSVVKIIALIAVSVAAFKIPPEAVFFGAVFFILTEKFYLKFTFSEILSDFKPLFAYIIMIECSTVIFALLSGTENSSFREIFIPSEKNIQLIMRLCLSFESTAIFYRTTTNQQLKNGLASIETFFFKNREPKISDTVSLTVSFIPLISKTWTAINYSWQNRNGPSNLYGFTKRLFVLFQILIKKAVEKSRALQARY